MNETVKTSSLWGLHGSPLPATIDVVDASFVTIWMVASIAFFFIFRKLAHKPSGWTEFRTLQQGTFAAFMWFFPNVIDRWLHYDQRTVQFGYIIFLPVMEFYYILSNALILWGTYTIVWKELEACRFKELHLRIWFGVGKLTLFLVCLLSLYYAVLNLALPIMWMQFLSLSVIEDIATKRTQFEISMTAMYFIYSLLTFAAATVALVGGNGVRGKIGKTRWVLWTATILLFARSISQFALIVKVDRTKITRQDIIMTEDITFGLITFLFLGAMVLVGWRVSEPLDRGGNDAGLVRSDVYHYILKNLKSDTTEGRQQAPSFEEVLQNVTTNLERVLDEGPLSASLQLDRDYKREIVREHVKDMRGKYGALNPREGRDFKSIGSRNSSPFSMLSRRRSTPQARRSTPESLLAQTPQSNGSRPRRTSSRDLLARFAPVHEER